MFNITINDKKYEIEEGLTIIEACDRLGIRIPRFCYHKDLSVPANCRMCLVEVKGGRKPVPSCHTKVANDMEIYTESDEVKGIRKGIMEFLLINHPLDCPICDEAGDCELQNQAVAYGFNNTSYEFDKRARENKYLGPLVSTTMTRCINCTRCIRFLEEVAGTKELGIVGRGENSDISNFFQKPINSELSGNLVDVCPVGALNNAQYLFKDRPWQLSHTNTIDVMDAVGSSITVNIEGDEVVKIMPLENHEVNGSWLADKSRYICDALNIQRLDTPWIKKNGTLQKATFEQAFSFIKSKVDSANNKIAALAGKFADVETMVVLKELINKLGSNLTDCRVDNIAFDNKEAQSYLFNSSITGIDKADFIVMVGTNPKKEAPLLNARILQSRQTKNTPIVYIGEEIELNYSYTHLGDNLKALEKLLNGKDDLAKSLSQAKNPMIIVGEGAFLNQNTESVLALLNKFCKKFNIIKDDWNGYNFIHTSIAKIGGMQAGFIPNDNKVTFNNILEKASAGELEVVWLLGVDDIDFSYLKNSFVIYQGHHGDKGAEYADVILPGSLWLEKSATYVNLEGRVLQTNIARKAPNLAKEDWKIIKAFADFINVDLPFNNLEEVRAKMIEINPCFANVGEIGTTKEVSSISKFDDKDLIDKIKDVTIKSTINDYYLTDIISRNSATMAKCSKIFNNINSTENI